MVSLGDLLVEAGLEKERLDECRTLAATTGESLDQVVLTKSDKVARAALNDRRHAIQTEIATRPAAHPTLMDTSAAKGLGIAELRAQLAGLAETAQLV